MGIANMDKVLYLNRRCGCWVDHAGKYFKSDEICAILNRCVGASYSKEGLDATFPRGAIYQNGSVWFQRID